MLFLLLLGVLLAGCARTHEQHFAVVKEQDEIESILRAVQELHGPPKDRWDLTRIVSARIAHDFNGNGEKELVLFFSDSGLGKLPIESLEQLNGVVTCGFIMLTRINDQFWPVFYYFSEYRVQISYKAVLNVTGLVDEGGRGGGQTVWGWKKNSDEWPGRWAAYFRIWDRDKQAYGPRRIMSRYLSNYGQ